MIYWLALLLGILLLLSQLSLSPIFPSDLSHTIMLTAQSDWFRLETLDDSLQPTIDMLLNLAIFMWFGAVCPWDLFAHNDIIPIYRLIALGVLILLLRRLPVVLAMHRYIRQVEHFSQAAFLGFFGPIGVGAIFYLSICREFLLEEVLVDGEPREDAQRTADAAYIVVWFLVICSIVRLAQNAAPVNPVATPSNSPNS
jgi:sodium/hydrogen antiporter